MYIKKKGFTLIELLLVIAIIAILAGAILVGITNQRQKARFTKTTQTLKSILPYVIECYMKGQVRDGAALVDYNPGDPICAGTSIAFPALPDGCSWWRIAGDDFADDTYKGGVYCRRDDTAEITAICFFTGSLSGTCTKRGDAHNN